MFTSFFGRRKIIKAFRSIVLSILLGFIGIGGNSSAYASSELRPTTGTIVIGGTILTQTWTSDNIYWIQSNATVDAASTLTIEANTIVKFNLNTSLNVIGILQLNGSYGYNVIFTSIRDDTGADTNGDGGNTTAAAGDWDFILLPNNNSTIQWATVRFSKRGVQVKNSSLFDISPHISNSIFNDNKNGIFLDINSAYNITSLIDDNDFTNNEIGITVDQESGKTGTALPVLSENRFNTNTILPIYLGGSAFPTYESNTFAGFPEPAQRLGIGLGGNFNYSGSLTQVYADQLNRALPYVVRENMTVVDGATLTLPEKTVIKFDVKNPTLQVSILGELINAGTAITPTIFTSIRDDIAGDTNGDGFDLEPLPGDWNRIYFLNKDIDFQYAMVRYATTAVYYDNTIHPGLLTIQHPTIQHCEFDHNVNGLYFKAFDGATSRTEPALTENSFYNTTGFVLTLENTNFPVYTDNSIQHDPGPGILLKGNWYTNGTWTSVLDSLGILIPYVVRTNVTIKTDASVMVPESSVFKLKNTDGTVVAKFSVLGNLDMNSTTSTPIIFTSYLDDVLNDTNHNGSATSPVKKDWKGIYLFNAATDFHDAIVKYSDLGVVVENATASELGPLIQDNTFTLNAYGIYLNIKSSGFIASWIGNNIFDGNDFGVVTDADIGTIGKSIPTLSENQFINQTDANLGDSTQTGFPIYLGGTAEPVYTSNSFANNARRAIALGGYWGADSTLLAVNGDSNSPFLGKVFPYVVIADMTVASGVYLTVPASTIIKVDAAKKIIINGGLLLQSYSGHEIYLTSFKDDYYDDTNGDGAGSTPTRTSWAGLYITSPTTTNIEYLIFKYSDNGLVIQQLGGVDLSPIIANNQFSENNKAITLHIKSGNDITASILNNTIFSNNYGLYTYSDTSTSTRYLGCANPTLDGNLFFGHDKFPIYLNGSSDPMYLTNTFSNNLHPAIAVHGYWACDATWTTVSGDINLPFPYVVYHDGTGTKYLEQDDSSMIIIPAATVVKFDLDTGMFACGILDLESTSADPIILTSYKDDRYIGDTNGDGATTIPTRTDWKSVWFCDSPIKTSIVHDVVAHYAVAALGVYYNGLVNTAISTVITNTLLEDNHGGIMLAVGGSGDIAAVIQDVTMIDNNYGLLTFAHANSIGIVRPKLTRVEFIDTAEYPIFLGGTSYPSFEDSVVMSSSNRDLQSEEEIKSPDIELQADLEINLQEFPGFLEKMKNIQPQQKTNSAANSPVSDLTVGPLQPAIGLAGAFNNEGTLVITKTVYAVTGDYPVSLTIDGITTTPSDDVTIGATNAAGSRVTFKGGSVIKFGAGRKMTVNGGLNLESTQSSPVIFTSIRDDSAGGDTNRDGNRTSPVKGNWIGIKLTSSATFFNYGILRYATEGLHIYFSGSMNQNISPEVSNSVFSNNTAGMTLWAAGTGDIISPPDKIAIHDNLFLKNDTHILGHTSTGRLMVDIHQNDFLPTATWGINNQSTNFDLDALDNYWGDASGPFHVSKNPNGLGVPVSDRVNFEPWSNSPNVEGITFAIQGRITKSDPNDPHPGIVGVEVNLLPGNIQVVTDQDGYYSFFDLMVGEYTLVPNLAGWLFAPSQYKVDLVADTIVNFVGTLGSTDYFITIDNVTTLQPLAGTQDVYFTVSLSKAATFPVVVSYKTENGTATEPSDYTKITSGTVSFNIGEVAKTIMVVVKSGSLDELVEDFKVVLYNPMPSSTIKIPIGGDVGICTIYLPSSLIYLPQVKK